MAPTFTLLGKEAFLKGTNVINTETFIVSLSPASVILPKWMVTLDELHKVSCFLWYTNSQIFHTNKSDQQNPSYLKPQHFWISPKWLFRKHSLYIQMQNFRINSAPKKKKKKKARQRTNSDLMSTEEHRPPDLSLILESTDLLYFLVFMDSHFLIFLCFPMCTCLCVYTCVWVQIQVQGGVRAGTKVNAGTFLTHSLPNFLRWDLSCLSG